MKIKNKILIVLTLIIISGVLSFFMYNYNVLFLDNDDKGVINIDLEKVSVNGLKYENGVFHSLTEKNKLIKIDYNGYIRKLNINYKIDNYSPISIKYKTKDYYGNDKNVEKAETFTNRLNKSYTIINSYVDDLEISIETEGNVDIDGINIDNSIGFNIYLFIFILFGLSILTILIMYFKCNLFDGKIEKLFLTLVLILGCLYIILEPHTTGYSWDDQIHFNTIFQIFELDGETAWCRSCNEMLDSDGNYSDVDTIEERRLQNNYLNSGKEITNINKTSPFIAYTQIGYLVPGLVLKICSILGLSFVASIVLTKLSMLLFYSIVIYYAIKITPRGKRIMAIYALFPTSLFLATHFSYDSPIIACMCLFIAQYLKILECKNYKIKLIDCLVLLITMIIISFIKAVYVPLILLLLFIPKNKFRNKKECRFFKYGVIGLCILILSTFVLPTVTETSLGDPRGGDTSVSAQLRNVVTHPVGYGLILKETAGEQFIDKLVGKEGIYSYAYINTNSGINYLNNTYYIILILLLFVIITDSNVEENSIFDKKMWKIIIISNIIINIGIIVLIWTALYLSFTPVGSLGINGVQNRYFIPLLIPIILITFANTKIKVTYDMKKYDSIILGIMSLVILYSLYSIFYVNFCL